MARSPKYPSISLQKAISIADKAFNAINLGSVDSETFYEAMGFQGRTGSSQKALASLKYYGLLEGSNSEVKLTDLYKRIALPLDVEEKNLAILEAARKPTLFATIFDEYQTLPPATILESIAIRKFAFSTIGAKKFVSKLLETDSFVQGIRAEQEINDESGDSSENETDYNYPENSELQLTNQAVTVPQTFNSNLPANGNEIMKFKLSKDLEADVIFYGDLDATGIQRLIRHLEFTAEIYDE